MERNHGCFRCSVVKDDEEEGQEICGSYCDRSPKTNCLSSRGPGMAGIEKKTSKGDPTCFLARISESNDPKGDSFGPLKPRIFSHVQLYGRNLEKALYDLETVAP